MHKLFANDEYTVCRGNDCKWHVYLHGEEVEYKYGSLIGSLGGFQSLAFIDNQGGLRHGVAEPADLGGKTDSEIIESFIATAKENPHELPNLWP